MDIDRYIARNQPVWDRLSDLTSRARRGLTGLSTAELDELVELYQRVSTQLSHARTYFGDTALTARLTRIVADARAVIYGKRPRSINSMGTFFALTFPGAVYHARRAVLAAALLFFVPALIMMVWLLHSPEALEASMPAEEREIYVQEQFEAYYSEGASVQFATTVGINNIFVSFIAFTFGSFLCIPGAYVLANNGVVFGQAGAWMTAGGEASTFWTLIAPHGLLELTSIVLAGAAGLRLGWTLIAPGDRTRTDAMREEGRRISALILGLVAFFVVAALIEGFITGSALPIQVKVGIGVVVWLAFVLYIVVQGRTANAMGITGIVGELDRRWEDEPVVVAASSAVVEVPTALP